MTDQSNAGPVYYSADVTNVSFRGNDLSWMLCSHLPPYSSFSLLLEVIRLKVDHSFIYSEAPLWSFHNQGFPVCWVYVTPLTAGLYWQRLGGAISQRMHWHIFIKVCSLRKMAAKVWEVLYSFQRLSTDNDLWLKTPGAGWYSTLVFPMFRESPMLS